MQPSPPVLLVSGSADGAQELVPASAGAAPPPLPPCPASESTPAVMLYTSGTTSDPKGVVLTHGNLRAEREGAFRVIQVDERDAILAILPLFHALAQIANLLLPLTAGTRIVFLETVNSAEMMRAFADRRITAFCVVPQFYYLLHQRISERVTASGWVARAGFRSLRRREHLAAGRMLRINLGPLLFRRAHAAIGGRMRIMVCGGSRFDPKVGRDLFGIGFNIVQAYGLTECSGAAHRHAPGRSARRHRGPSARGRRSPHRSGPAAAPDREYQDGEVLIREPDRHGRLPQPARRECGGARRRLAAHRGPRVPRPRRPPRHHRPQEGDHRPRVRQEHLSGRGREPLRDVAFIKELCVLGVALPGEPSAERLHAVVVPDLEVMRERRIVNFREIIRFDIESLSLTLPHHKRVLSFDVWMEDLPRTTTRKLKRHEIERLYRDRRRAPPASANRPTGTTRTKRGPPILSRPGSSTIIREAAPRGVAVRPDANLELDLGLDSMERVELLVDESEHDFGVDVPEDVAQGILTVRHLAEAIDPLASSAGSPAEAAVDPWARVLAADESDPVLAEVLRPKPVFSRLAYAVVRTLHLAARVLLGLRVEGREHLPADGTFIISPNHQSFLDAFVLLGALPFRSFRRLFFVGASEYFETPFMRRLAELMNVVPVDPDANLLRAMQAGAFGLRRNLVLTLFPEGERSPDGTPRRFKKGAAITALQTGVPIVPVALHGFFEIWPRGSGMRWGAWLPWSRTQCTIRVGRPIPPDASPEGAGDRYERHTALLRSAVVEMWDALEAERRKPR